MSYRSVFRADTFAGKRALVTGGGSGIGRATAHELASLGCELVLVGRTQSKLDEVAAELEAATGQSALALSCDIREEAAVQAMVRQATSAGPVDYLVNNAGGQFMAPLETISTRGWEAVVRNNLTGGFLVARELFGACLQRRGGAIVNVIADMWRSMPMMGHSGAARAGMLSLTETAAVEWAQYGIRVNAVAPGYIASSGMAKYPEAMRPVLAQMKSWVPAQRLGTESEVSAAIVFLLSDAAAFITGSCLRVDGGAPNARVGWPLAAHRRMPAFHGFDGETHLDFLE